MQIVPQNDRRLRAIELSVPTVIATFQVKHRNSDGIIVDSRVYNIDLNSGTYLLLLTAIIHTTVHSVSRTRIVPYRIGPALGEP